MYDVLQFFVLGITQGLTEFLPVSSTGHLILIREFFGFDTARGLAIDAILQLATALAVIVYFFKDYVKLGLSLVYRMSGRAYDASDFRLLIVIIAGTVPAIIVGLLLEDAMETLFRSAELVAYTLVFGSIIMLGAEYTLSKSTKKEELPSLGYRKGIVIGLFQALALIPGMSRSGMTISGGIFMGLTRESAARFGFLLSVPIILGSGAKKLLELIGDGTLGVIGFDLFIGFFAAFVSGLAAIHLLLMFVRTQPLYVFVVYRLALAALILALL